MVTYPFKWKILELDGKVNPKPKKKKTERKKEKEKKYHTLYCYMILVINRVTPPLK